MSTQHTLDGNEIVRSDAERAADLFQDHREELGFVNRAQCEEGDLYLVERDGEVVGAALGNHCVQKPQTTLYELAVADEYRRQGIATELLEKMVADSPHEKIVAKCPAELESNEFYRAQDWKHARTEDGKNRALNVWELSLADETTGDTVCTNQLCHEPAEYVVYYPKSDEYSRRNGDGDLSPFMCEGCADKRRVSEFGKIVEHATHSKQLTLTEMGAERDNTSENEVNPDR